MPVWGWFLLAGIAVFFLMPWVMARRKKGKPIPEELVKTFGTETLNPGYLYIWGKNCAPCRVMTPRMENLRKKGIPVHSVAVEDAGSGIFKLGVMSTPTVLLIRKNTILDVLIGLKEESDLESLIRTYQQE